MNSLLQFFEEKVFWYKKYLLCNEAYLQALKHAPEIAIDEIELFYGNRESLLKILEKIDNKIQAVLDAGEMTKGEIDSSLKTKIQFYLREKDSIIERVLQLDNEIILILEELRTNGDKRVKALTKGKKALKSYKSGDDSKSKIDKRV